MNLKEISEKENLVIDFFAEWCGPCKMVTPIIESLEKEFTNVEFLKLNVDDEDNDLLKHFNIRSIPTVIFMKNGVAIEKLIGANNREVYKQKIENLIKNETKRT